MNPTLTLVASLLQALFSKNVLVQELIPILEQAGAAFASAKSGQPFSISFPETIAGKAGTTSVAWSPTV